MTDMNRHWAEKNGAEGVTDVGILSIHADNGIKVVTYRCNVDSMTIGAYPIARPFIRVEIDANAILGGDGVAAAIRATEHRNAVMGAVNDSESALPDRIYDLVGLWDDDPSEGVDIGPDQHTLGALIYPKDAEAEAYLAGDKFMERVHAIAIKSVGKTLEKESKRQAKAEAAKAEAEAKAARKPCLLIAHSDGSVHEYPPAGIDDDLLFDLYLLKGGLKQGFGSVRVSWKETDVARRQGIDLSEFAGEHQLSAEGEYPCVIIYYQDDFQGRHWYAADVDDALLRQLDMLKRGLVPGDGVVKVIWTETEMSRIYGIDLSAYAGEHNLNSDLMPSAAIYAYPGLGEALSGKASESTRLATVARVAFGDIALERPIVDAKSLADCVADLNAAPSLQESQRVITLARIVRNLHHAGLIRLGRGRRELLNCAEDIECGIGRYIGGRLEWASGLARAALLEAAMPRGGKPKRVRARPAASHMQARAA